MISDKMASDETLISSCKFGDRAAFNELIERYKKMGFSLAYNMTGSLEDAEDISQEAFVIVYSKINSFREESSFRTWFYKIVLNLCRKCYRKRKLRSLISFDIINKQGDDQTEKAGPEIGPERELSSRQTGRAIFSALRQLPVRQREVFTMKHLRGMKISEISEVLDCKEGTVKSHLFRAVRKLQESLEEV